MFISGQLLKVEPVSGNQGTPEAYSFLRAHILDGVEVIPARVGDHYGALPEVGSSLSAEVTVRAYRGKDGARLSYTLVSPVREFAAAWAVQRSGPGPLQRRTGPWPSFDPQTIKRRAAHIMPENSGGAGSIPAEALDALLDAQVDPEVQFCDPCGVRRAVLIVMLHRPMDGAESILYCDVCAGLALPGLAAMAPRVAPGLVITIAGVWPVLVVGIVSAWAVAITGLAEAAVRVGRVGA